MYSRKWFVRIGAFLLILAITTMCLMAAEGMVDEKSQLLSAVPLTNGLLEANSNRQVHPLSSEAVSSTFTTEGFEQIGETDELLVFLNRAEAALRILNKNTGYLWGSVSIEEAEGLNSSWRCYGNGLVSIECFNQEGAEKKVSIGKDGSAVYDIMENGMLCTATFSEQGISFQVLVSWEKNKLSMQLVEGSLKEGMNESKDTLKSITFMPFLGCSFSDSIDGYILIPDGSGALIRYSLPANYSSTFAGRIYGIDYGIASLSSTAGNSSRPEGQVLMPVYGMVHGAYQNGFLAVVESGAEYATILANPAQSNNPYNWAAAQFEVRQKYVKNINRKEGAGANVPQEVPNAVTPEISFYFLSGEQANYDGMAVMYREQLIDKGILTPISEQDCQVPLQIEILGADKKENFLWKTTEVFTSAKQAEEMVQDLFESGMNDLDVVFRCYTKNNECGTGFLRALGDQKEFEALNALINQRGGTLYYYLDPITANKDQITLRTEAANNLSKAEISWVDNWASQMYQNTYLYRISVAEQRVEQAIDRSYGGSFAVGQVTNKLYSDFTSGKEVTRAENLERVSSLFNNLCKDRKIALYQPNQYLWQYANKMYDLPISNSQILYETDCVPFLQIVLSGCVEMYGSTINTSSYSQERLLRQIEYGMAPAFTVTACDSMNLYNTAQERYFSTNYEDWKPQMQESYQTTCEGLGKVWGHSIISHCCLQPGLIRVEYDNGVSIYLNYTDKAIRVDNIQVEAGDFFVLEGK